MNTADIGAKRPAKKVIHFQRGPTTTLPLRGPFPGSRGPDTTLKIKSVAYVRDVPPDFGELQMKRLEWLVQDARFARVKALARSHGKPRRGSW